MPELFAATKIPVPKPVQYEWLIERDETGQPVRMVWVGGKPDA